MVLLSEVKTKAVYCKETLDYFPFSASFLSILILLYTVIFHNHPFDSHPSLVQCSVFIFPRLCRAVSRRRRLHMVFIILYLCVNCDGYDGGGRGHNGNGNTNHIKFDIKQGGLKLFKCETYQTKYSNYHYHQCLILI